MKTVVLTLIAIGGLTGALQAQVPDFTPQTPLIGALLHHDTRTATRLLDEGADPNEGRFVGFSPFASRDRPRGRRPRTLIGSEGC